ncbi:MAG TPA: EscU/YscU/HrcU family type III secretion system export apparatus switch protein [Pseudolabrys sp.]
MGSRQWPFLDIPIPSLLRTRLDWARARQWVTTGRKCLRAPKEEFKQTEGDPAIKGKIEQVRQVRRRRRRIAAAPKATVSTKG